jgi:hypothetical protein
MYEMLNDVNSDSSTKNDTSNLLNEKDEKDIYPNKLNIIIFTNISDESIDYNPKMSYPSTTSSNVYFSPFIKLSEPDLLPDISLLSNSKELPKKSFDIFFNEKNFNELLQKKVDQNNDNFLKIEQSCKDKVIDNNIKNILNILFKSGNLFYIKDKPYTINNYEWTTGDWFIYSSELDKKTTANYDILKRDKEPTSEKQTKEAYELISKKTPNCLKGDATTSLIHSENQKKLYEEKMNNFTNNLFFNKEKIDQIFKTYKEGSLNIFDNYLCFNLNDQIPSFDKDPLTISLLYIGNNFIKDIEKYPILLKYYNAVNTNGSELNEIINEINSIVIKNNLLKNNNNDNRIFESIFDYNKVLSKTLDKIIIKLEDHIKAAPFFKSWFKNQESILATIIQNYAELMNLFKDKEKTKNIKLFLTEKTQKNINKFLLNIKNSIQQLLDDIKNSAINQTTRTLQVENKIDYSEIKDRFNKKKKDIDSIKRDFTKALTGITQNSNEIYKNFELLTDGKKLPDTFIKDKIEFIKVCKKVYTLIKQKIISQNDYLNKLFIFYKILYTLKKKEYENITKSQQSFFNSSSFKNADNIRLQLSIRIILFDVIIYNTLIYNTCYRNVYNLYLKNIDFVIKKLEELEIKKFNIRDDTINSSFDKNSELINLFKHYYYYIFFINFNLDKIMWDIISKKTLDIKNKFKCFISKSINEYAKNINLYEDTNETIITQIKTQVDNLYNLDFSNFSEQESMKIICYELINLFSKINIITLYRYYKTNTINYFLCNNLSKQIKYNNKEDIEYIFNKIYGIYDFKTLKLEDDTSNQVCISSPNTNCVVLDKLCYEDYKTSVDLITPAITDEQLERLCENISKTEEYEEFTNKLIQTDFESVDNFFKFKLYKLFNGLFNDETNIEYENIYGIYNGNNLLKTILDSIRWGLSIQNYKFLYNDECNNFNSINNSNNNNYKLILIDFFYINYKLNVVIITKNKDIYNIIKKDNADNYPYIYILNESVNIMNTITETYYNIYFNSSSITSSSFTSSITSSSDKLFIFNNYNSTEKNIENPINQIIIENIQLPTQVNTTDNNDPSQVKEKNILNMAELEKLSKTINDPTQTGGQEQKQEIENIMKQFIKNKKIKVKIENKINDKKYNNLYYYVPIKLILNEGTDKIDLTKKLEFSCSNNYEQLRKAWALLLGIEYIPTIITSKEEPTSIKKEPNPIKEEPIPIKKEPKLIKKELNPTKDGLENVKEET